MDPLSQLGWDTFFANAASGLLTGALRPARVAAIDRGVVTVWDATGEWPAVVPGRFRFATTGATFPVTGDWTLVEPVPREEKLIIRHILPRRTTISRNAAGGTTEEQIVSANLDTIFVLASLADTLNLPRIERYLTAVWQGGAEPVVLLTKADLCEDPDGAVAQIKTIARESRVLALSSISGKGLRKLVPWLKPSRTCAVIGPSGVGKSTLINALYDEEILDVIPVREKDQKGRHTTTRRELVYLPTGGLIIDTPGMRELQLWEGQVGLNEAFDDIEALIAQCRFSNCQHKTEPGCAVRAALDARTLEDRRFQSYTKLQSEIVQSAAKRSQRAQNDERKRAKLMTRTLNDRLREKGRI